MKSLSEVALDCMVCAPRFGLHFEPTWRYVGGKFVVAKGLEQKVPSSLYERSFYRNEGACNNGIVRKSMSQQNIQ